MEPNPSGVDLRGFYDDYSRLVAMRLGYPTRATYKAYLAWRRFRDPLLKMTDDIQLVADVGGCFGFGLNAFLHHGGQILGHEIHGDLYELSSYYCEVGRMLFPHIGFRTEDFAESELERPYDVTLMFDFLEHVPDMDGILAAARSRTRFLIVKTPLESTTREEKLLATGAIPPRLSGDKHPEGHVRFFTISSFLEALTRHFEVRSVWICPLSTFQPPEVIEPESLIWNPTPREAGSNQMSDSSRRGVRRLLGSRIWRDRILRAHRRLTPISDPLYVRAVARGMLHGAALVLARSNDLGGSR